MNYVLRDDEKRTYKYSRVSFLAITDTSHPGNLRCVTIKKSDLPSLLNLLAISGMDGMFRCFVNNNILHLIFEHNIWG